MPLSGLRVLIVGDGLAGCLMAWELQSRGLKTCIWSDGKAGASAVAAGMFNPVSFRRILPTWNARVHLDKARSIYQRLEKRTGQTLWHDVPVWRVFPDEAYASLWQSRIEENHPVSEFISSVDPLDIHPSIHAPFGAGKVAEAGWVDVTRLLEWSRGFWQSEGCWEEKSWQLDSGCPDGWDAVIDCRGVGATDDLAKLGLQVRPNHGEVLTVKSDGLGCHETVNNAIWLLPIGNDSYRMGSTYRWDIFDDRTLMESQTAMIQRANEARKGSPISQDLVMDHRAGLRPASPDRRPLLGPVSAKHPWYTVCNGWGTRGVVIGPQAVFDLAEYMEHGKPLPHEVVPQRFHTFRKK